MRRNGPPGTSRILNRSLVLATLAACCCFVSSAGAQETKADARPFTGFLKIRQKDGALSYEVAVIRGKVTSGIVAYGTHDDVKHDIVGGWFDRERLMLLIQSRGDDLGNPWSSHAHQFQRTADGFTLEHSLYGYGKTMATGKVYQPHVIDQMVEVSGGPGDRR